MKKILIAVELLILLLLVGGLLFMYSGVYNIAASEAHFPVVEWVYRTTMKNSVRAHAKDVTLSSFYENADPEEGFRHFQETCEMCHGAPELEPSEIGKGLNPNPPDLSDVAEEWSPEEIYWIVKNGIKMSGMPALGLTHSEKQVWAIAAFVKKLPEISPQDYRDMKRGIPSEGNHHHEDGHGQPDTGEPK